MMGFGNRQTATSGFAMEMATDAAPARGLIPGAYERDHPLHRNTSVAPALPVAPAVAMRPLPALEEPRYVVAAPYKPTTWPARCAAVLGDLALAIGIIYALVLASVLVVRLLATAAAFIGEAMGLGNTPK